MSTIAVNDKIFVQEALQAFTATLTPLNAFSRSYSSATARKGDAVSIPRVDALTTTTFAYANNSNFPYETDGGTIGQITVSLDQHQIVGVDITDIQAANASSAEIVNFARQQGKALARKVLGNIWGIVLTTNFGLGVITTLSVADIGRLAISGARTLFGKRNVPLGNESLVVNMDVYQNLLNDANISQAFQYGGSEAIREGRIPRLLGMNVFSSNLLPGNSLSLAGMIVHPDAIAVAVRTLQPQASEAYLAVETAVDDETGLAFTYRRHFNPGRGKHYASFECLFGFTQALTLGLGIIQRTD
jgi:hypothetical protein